MDKWTNQRTNEPIPIRTLCFELTVFVFWCGVQCLMHVSHWNKRHWIHQLELVLSNGVCVYVCDIITKYAMDGNHCNENHINHIQSERNATFQVSSSDFLVFFFFYFPFVQFWLRLLLFGSFFMLSARRRTTNTRGNICFSDILIANSGRMEELVKKEIAKFVNFMQSGQVKYAWVMNIINKLFCRPLHMPSNNKGKINQ